MRVLVLTVVHTPLDARIYHRQLRTLVEAGWEVRYAAPWTAYGLTPPGDIEVVDLPRARGRRRRRALLAATRLLRRTRDVDVVLLHDPELLVAAALARPRLPLVWDVHEDTAAALVDRSWLPVVLRRPVAAMVGAVERLAERRVSLLLAEEAYASRFARTHPVVRNVPRVPATRPGGVVEDRVVYIGRLSRYRGALELLELGRRLRPTGVVVELVGPADPDVEPSLRRANAAGEVDWRGFLPNEQALARVEGSLAGIALLHDVPNYRVSMPTKVVEYLSRGVPVITTPLPLAVDVVASAGGGTVVGFGDVAGAAAAVMHLRDHPEEREAMSRRGYEAVRAGYDWQVDGRRFIAHLEAAAGRSSAPGTPGASG